MKGLRSVIALSVLVATGTLHAETFRYNYGIGSAKSSETTPPTPSNWVAASPVYGDWVDVDSLYGCSNWSPSSSGIASTTTFTQTATDCTTDQTRTRQDREENRESGEIRNKGESVTETQRLDGQPASRTYGVMYYGWVDMGSVYDCTWLPLVSDYPAGEVFTQNGTGCKLNQTTNRMDYYQDHKTGDYLVVFEGPVNRTITGQRTARNAIGTKDYFVSTLSPSPSVISGGATSTVTAVVMDTNGKMAPGISVYFTTDMGWLSDDYGTTDASGKTSTVLNCVECTGNITITAVASNGVEVKTVVRATP